MIPKPKQPGDATNSDGAGKPKLELSASAPNLALKDGAPPAVGKGLRSPVAGGAAASPAAAPAAKPQATAAKAKAAQPAPEVSDIRKMDVFSRHESNATRISHHMADRSRGRSKKLLLTLIVLAVVATAGAMVAMPDLRRETFGKIAQSYDDLIGTVRYRKKERSTAPANKSEPRVAYVPAARPTAGTGDCRTLIHKATGMGAVPLPQRLQTADCYLLIDDPVGAEAVLKPTMARVARASEAELNGMGSNMTLSDAHQTMVGILLRQGRMREAGELLRGRCQRWTQSNTCVAKLMLLAERRSSVDGGDALSVMFGSRGRLDAKAQARVWLAGAALAQGNPKVADKRYVMALSAAPKQAMALRKQIYEAQAVDLYHRGELLKLKGAVGRAQADMKALQPGAKVKLQLLSDLATSADRAKVVRQAMSREEVTFRARADFDLIEILGPESLRYSQQEAFLRLIQRTRTHYQTKFRAAESFVKRLDAWDARAQLSAGRYEEVLTKINAYNKDHGADVMSHHLRGNAYLLMSESKQSRLMAATAYQDALKVSSNWESLYALGVALTRGGRPQQVAAVIKDLDRKVTTSGQRYWSDMLKAEWYVAKGKYPNAQKILTQWAEAEPTFYGPPTLQLQLFQKLGRKADAEAAEQRLEDLRKTQAYQASREAFASPLGALAIARRPID